MYPLAQFQVVARCIYGPYLRLAAGTAVVVNRVEQLALEGLEQHAVTGVVAFECNLLLNPRTLDAAAG